MMSRADRSALGLGMIPVLAMSVLLAMLPLSALAQALELVQAEIDPPIPGQFPTVTDGYVEQVDSTYGSWSSQHRWTPPPARIEGPITMEIGVVGISSPAYIAPGTGLSAIGFEVSLDPAHVFVDARDGATVSDSVSITLTPSSSLTAGSTAEIRIGAAYGPGVTYRYVVADGAGEDGEDDEDGTGDDLTDDEPVLDARVECPSDTIVISALPSLSCEIVISGWRYSADPVLVLLPGVIDGWGNQANGLQSVQNGATNAQDPTNWTRPEYRWWLPVFACPSQSGTGANCNGAVTLPGAVSMPIIVRQKGQPEVQLVLTLSAVSHSTGSPLSSGIVRFGNRWTAGDLLNIESGRLQASAIRADWLSALWVIVPVEGTEFVRLQSRWQPDLYLHGENGGQIEAGPISLDWHSAMWRLEPVEGTRYIRIANRWWQGEYLHTESGILDLGPVEPDWLSAQWWTME